MRSITVPVITVLLLVGCASTETQVEPQQNKEFVTGSNISRKDRSDVSVASKEALERFQNSSGGPTQRGRETAPTK